MKSYARYDEDEEASTWAAKLRHTGTGAVVFALDKRRSWSDPNMPCHIDDELSSQPRSSDVITSIRYITGPIYSSRPDGGDTDVEKGFPRVCG